MASWTWMYWPLLAAILFAVEEAAVPVTPNMKTFSHAIKNSFLMNNSENVVFEHNSGPGVVTEQWFAGRGCMDEDTVMKIYIDGETTPSLDFNLYLAHGIGKPHAVPVCLFITSLCNMHVSGLLFRCLSMSKISENVGVSAFDSLHK